MAVARIAAALGTALAVLVSLPVQAGGAHLVVRFGSDAHPQHPHGGHRSLHSHHHHHRHHSLDRLRPHQHFDSHHRPHHGHLHRPRIVIHYAVPVPVHITPAPAYAAPASGPFVLGVPAFAVDGDTFDAGGVRYRLAGIDTPELHEPHGYNARARLQQLLSLGELRLIPLGTDAYGRTLVEVLVGSWNVSGVLRAEGYAK